MTFVIDSSNELYQFRQVKIVYLNTKKYNHGKFNESKQVSAKFQ